MVPLLFEIFSSNKHLVTSMVPPYPVYIRLSSKRLFLNIDLSKATHWPEAALEGYNLMKVEA